MANAYWKFYEEQAKILDEYKAIFPEKKGKKNCILTLWNERKNSNDNDKKIHKARKEELKQANERARLAEEKVENLENEKKEFIKLINELCVKLNNKEDKK
jgi:hypothetical protein